MNVLVPLALFGWIPLMLAVFACCRVRTAVLVALFGGWLFLPMAGYPVTGLPDFDKFTAITLAALVGVLAFDGGCLTRLRPSLWDLPMLVWTLCPFASAVTGGFGVYEGLSSVANIMLSSGIAYFVGRIYFADPQGQRALARAFVIAGLIYVPLCLYEIRMSPQLHTDVYGFHQHSFSQTHRMGGWRPTVFMQHGLAVGLFMAAATAVAAWLWLSRQQRTLVGLPMWIIVAALLVTTVLCKSIFSIMMLGAVLAVLGVVWLTRRPTAVVLLALWPAVYMTGRISGLIEGDTLVRATEQVAGQRRSGSVAVRIQSEQVLIPAAMQEPLFGHGRWGSLVVDERGRRFDKEEYGHKAIPDAMWVVTLANRGLIGLGAMTLVFLLPALALLRRGRYGRAPPVAPTATAATALAVVLAMHMCDNLLNAMYSPVFWTVAGGLTGALAAKAPTPSPPVMFRGAEKPIPRGDAKRCHWPSSL